MEPDDALYRLQSLQRDLVAFSESRLPNVDRLAAELESSLEDLKTFLDNKKRSEASRKNVLQTTTPGPDTLKIGDAEYMVNDEFRQAAVKVADELDLDELESAKLCLDVQSTDVAGPDATIALRAVLRFNERRQTMLECMRLLVQQYSDAPTMDDEFGKYIVESTIDKLFETPEGPRDAGTRLFRRCTAGLEHAETRLRKTADERQKLMMTGQSLDSDYGQALDIQQLLLTRQHESLVLIMACLLNGRFVIEVPDYRTLMTNLARAEVTLDITFHYVPLLIASAARFGSSEHIQLDTARELYRLFAPGPAQLKWTMPGPKSVAVVSWLAEFSHHFEDPTVGEPRVADRQKAEQDRSDLFMQAVKDRAFHVLLAACKWLKPEVWHDPAKVGLVDFLLANVGPVPAGSPAPSAEFAALTMRELQSFADALVSNMPDVIRRLKSEEDDHRRLHFSMPAEPSRFEPDLERFMVVMSYAYEGDVESSQDFWSDKESNLHGFLRWVSQRLPTPRVAAFCELLTSIASDANSANQAHRFLLEDTTMVSGKLRKTYSVSWAQIFAELDTFATSLKDKPAVPQSAMQDGVIGGAEYIEGVETSIMLEAYLRLASHICEVSPEARNWLLREQPFHLGENMLQLASSSIEGRLQASGFNMLRALLTNKVIEINDGLWAMLDNWISAGGPAAAALPRLNGPGTSAPPEKQYLQRFADRPETATAFVALITALIRPSSSQDSTLDSLPFPENLGAPNRHVGIEAYVDFAIGTVFRRSIEYLQAGVDVTEIDVLRFVCLDFIFVALSTFNEDLIIIANTTNTAMDSALRASSLAAYARLHPFARVMEWLFNNNVIVALFVTVQQSGIDLDGTDFASPRVQAVLRAVQVMNLAMKLQTTYFDIVRPLVKTQSGSRAAPVANASFASFDEVMLSQLPAVIDVVGFATSSFADLSLETLDLLQKLASSRKIANMLDSGSAPRGRVNRLVGALMSSSDAISTALLPAFDITELDIETGDRPLKVVKAQATLDMLNRSLDASATRPTIAHCFLGFACGERTLSVLPDGMFSRSDSLFHAIARCSASIPVTFGSSHLSWLLAVKRGCLEVVCKLVLSPLTANLVKDELLSMELLEALSFGQTTIKSVPLWDARDAKAEDFLLSESAAAATDFLKVQELFFEYAALQLRSAAIQRAYSVQESTAGTLFGVVPMSAGETAPTLSLFELFDFCDLETAPALDVTRKLLANVDLSACIEGDAETGINFNLRTAEQLLTMKSREVVASGSLRDVNEEQQLQDEVTATLASLLSRNNFHAIRKAKFSTLEAWAELLSLIMTSGGLDARALTAVALQGLQIIIPKLERSLVDDTESTALLARLTHVLAQPTITILSTGQQGANTAHERLLAAFRVCLKIVTESTADLVLRDVCYRTCIAVINCLPLKSAGSTISPTPHTKQILQLTQHAGDRPLAVATEDAFSGRGPTRVAAILFLDSLTALSQAANMSATLLKSLSKLNFVPVLIDTSIGSVASSFQVQNDDLATTLAYFHTALALLLRISTTSEGTQLVLSSGFFSSISDSRLFSTDPDIGLDIDNPAALREFYRLLSAVLRVVTAIVLSRGANNASTLQQAKRFLQQNRFSIQAVFKRTSSVQRTSGPPEKEAMMVAEEFGKLMLVTDFLEVR
jgi:nuclear pore complex protein Nup205